MWVRHRILILGTTVFIVAELLSIANARPLNREVVPPSNSSTALISDAIDMAQLAKPMTAPATVPAVNNVLFKSTQTPTAVATSNDSVNSAVLRAPLYKAPPPVYIPLPGEHVGLDPYTCYTYNWSDNWHIAYGYDVTPHADGTKSVMYMGGGGSNTPLPQNPPDMCLFNVPPKTTPGNPDYPGGLYPDTSPH